MDIKILMLYRVCRCPHPDTKNVKCLTLVLHEGARCGILILLLKKTEKRSLPIFRIIAGSGG